MARKIIRLAAFRPVRERFRGIRWNRRNLLWHEANKRVDPRFPVACKLDWARILKRPDIRFDDGRQMALVARPFRATRIVHFAAFIKRSGNLHAISIGSADSDEKGACFGHFPQRSGPGTGA